MVVTKDEVKAIDRLTGVTVALSVAVAVTGNGAGGQAQQRRVLEGT
jgi:hypothetical protein